MIYYAPLCQSSGLSDPETDPAEKTPKITDPAQKKTPNPAENGDFPLNPVIFQ